VQRWYISFHGGDHSLEWNNIHIYDLDGKPIGNGHPGLLALELRSKFHETAEMLA
jgi:hypothetical protein